MLAWFLIAVTEHHRRECILSTRFFYIHAVLVLCLLGQSFILITGPSKICKKFVYVLTSTTFVRSSIIEYDAEGFSNISLLLKEGGIFIILYGELLIEVACKVTYN